MAESSPSITEVGNFYKLTDTPPDIEISEFDDKEYDIPPCETPPTLENILNEPDNFSILDDEDLTSLVGFVQADSLDTSSASSHDSHSLGTPNKHRKHLNVPKHEEISHGSVLKPSKLKNISAQILSAADRVDAGMPSAMAVSQLIAIGTSHGLVLVFDAKQVLKWCLGSTAVGAQYGAVSALSFNIDSTRLLSGFAKGQITMWDLTSGKLLRTITDAHPVGCAILHVKFTDSYTVAVCSDSGGSVFELEFKRLIAVRTTDSRCLFSGSRGEVCVVEPLHMNYTIKDHPMQDVTLLAMASLSKILLVTLKPQLKVMFTHSLKGAPTTLPLLAWQFVVIQVTDVDRVIDPVLAFARESTIFFYQVICHSDQDIKCQGLQKMILPYTLLSIQWMNARTMVTLDTTEKVHVIDVRSEEELEVIDISDLQLVYGSSYFKSLATGGNVSQALACAGEQSCYQSLECFSGQLFILGTKSVHTLTLRTWRERIDVLVKDNQYKDALSLALSFYDGRAKAVIGLNGTPAKKREIVADLILSLLYDYVDLAMTQFCPLQGKIEELEQHYQEVVPVCVDYCLHLGRMDTLFGHIYERFSADIIAKSTFLECLEPYILQDKLTTILPTVMKDFIDCFETRGLLDNFEACIVHLDIASLDIHQIVKLCWRHDLYDAIIYVYNRGMRDYITPLVDLLTKLNEAVMRGIQLTENEIRLGNKLLVYVSCCLAGRAYPLGEIPDDIVDQVREDMFTCLTLSQSNPPITGELPYPHIRTVLLYDTPEFLNVLALAFEESEFNSPEGCIKRQKLIDILIEIMVHNDGFTPSQIGVLFTFLARQMSRHEKTISVNRDLFEQVLEFLSNPEIESRHEERHQALLDLLNTRGLQEFDEDRLLHLAHNAKFYQVCELLHERRREYDLIVQCYLEDKSRQHQVFAFISSIMQGSEFSAAEKSSVKLLALNNLQELMTIDCEHTARLVLEVFAQDLIEIIGRLKTYPKLLLDFLHGVLLYWESSRSAIYPDRQPTLEAEVFEEYIDLLCQYRPKDVCPYIKAHTGYRLEQTLEICRRHNVTDGTAFLLERAGDIQGAFRIVLETLQGKLHCLVKSIVSPTKDNPSSDQDSQLRSVQYFLLVVIQLCQRNSSKMDEAAREALWFPLLEAMMLPQRQIRDVANKTILTAYKELTHHVLNSMMGYIALPSILQKIMQDPAYNIGKFGEVKELILGMLETYNYEETLMTTCKNLMYHDLHTHLSNLTATATRGYVPKMLSCYVCRRSLSVVTDSDSVIVFRCGHSFHLTCLHQIESRRVIDGDDVWTCCMCHNKKSIRHAERNKTRHSGIRVTTQAESSPPNEMVTETHYPESYEHYRRCMTTKSRLQVLQELSRSTNSHSSLQTSGSILQNENFELTLSPPIRLASVT